MTTQPKSSFDVFLSYSREDQAVVSLVHDELCRRGLSVWRDTGQIVAGDAFIQKLADGLTKSRAVVVFCSAAALGSDWVQREWNVAFTLNTRIIPIRLDNSDIPVMLRPLNFIDLCDLARVSEAVYAITLALGSAASRLPPVNPIASSNPSVLGREVVVLERLISGEQQTVRSLRTARMAAVATGLGFTVAAAVFGPAESAAVIGIGCVMVAGILTVVLSTQLRAKQAKIKVFGALRDGVEVYCPSQPPCVEFRMRFETLLKEAAGLEKSIK